MLNKYEPVWLENLGHINVTEHVIDLNPGERPINSPPYRAGPKEG